MKQMIDYPKLNELVKDIDVARAFGFSNEYADRFDAVVYSDMHSDSGYAIRYGKSIDSETKRQAFADGIKYSITLLSCYLAIEKELGKPLPMKRRSKRNKNKKS